MYQRMYGFPIPNKRIQPMNKRLYVFATYFHGNPYPTKVCMDGDTAEEALAKANIYLGVLLGIGTPLELVDEYPAED